MYRVISGAAVPIRVWARSISKETERQLERLANQPYVVGFVCAMADAHFAEGVAVGSVFATERTVVPRALGGDLGCGMSAVRIGEAPDRSVLERIVRDLDRVIPTGDAIHAKGSAPDAIFARSLSARSLERTRDVLAARHLGTLGGGNHFLELDRDPNGDLWLLVHSGSRGLGAAVAKHHGHAAELDTESDAGRAYLLDVGWALDFAKHNREALARRALEVIGEHWPVSASDEPVDIHHNFVARERWLDRDLYVHRKGAVAVPLGTRALVPGSMGTASYLVEGLGNPDAFGSCSHGAGRVLSRRDARLRIPPKALAHAMRRIVHPPRKNLVEEAPSAYRAIGEVLDDQEDLVRRQLRLEPVAVLKG